MDGRMPPDRHALLSASSSDRWIHCPPSARLCEKYADKGSDYAIEGTDAHALCEFKLRKALGREAEDPTANLTWFNQEMDDCASGYAAFVMEQLATARETCADPVALIEQRVDFSRWVREGFGTSDAILIADGTMHVIDYKHGLGILVSAEDNPQMKCYALGALELFDSIYDIDTVAMTIYQPRRQNISTFRMTKEELYQWADEILKPTADLAFAGDGEFRCGEWCGFCKAKNECRARAEANLALARYEFKEPPLLTDEDIEDILSRVDDLVTWASDIKEYARLQAISGKEWKGWKLVEGRSNRQYTNEAAIEKTVSDAGFDPIEHKLLGITAMQKMLGKARFEELIGPYLDKPQGKPTLVPESDERPAMNTAKSDFKEEKKQ
jgi:hypothetical protein